MQKEPSLCVSVPLEGLNKDSIVATSSNHRPLSHSVQSNAIPVVRSIITNTKKIYNTTLSLSDLFVFVMLFQR